jgi:hypothetical protein
MSLRTPETRGKSTLTFPSLIGTFALSLFADRGTKPSEFKPRDPRCRSRDLASPRPRDLRDQMLVPSTPETRCPEISRRVNLTMNHSMRENAETSLLAIPRFPLRELRALLNELPKRPIHELSRAPRDSFDASAFPNLRTFFCSLCRLHCPRSVSLSLLHLEHEECLSTRWFANLRLFLPCSDFSGSCLPPHFPLRHSDFNSSIKSHTQHMKEMCNKKQICKGIMPTAHRE